MHHLLHRWLVLMKDHFAIDFICDTLRMMTMNLEDPHQVEDAMEKQLEKHHHEALAPSHALSSLADALPALGIVAAVLGVIKTMGAITEPPEILGMMIGGALVGTFLGVFLAYGMVGPLSARMKDVTEEERPSTASSNRCWSPTCTETPRRYRSKSAAAACHRQRNRASWNWKSTWAPSPPRHYFNRRFDHFRFFFRFEGLRAYPLRPILTSIQSVLP